MTFYRLSQEYRRLLLLLLLLLLVAYPRVVRGNFFRMVLLNILLIL